MHRHKCNNNFLLTIILNYFKDLTGEKLVEFFLDQTESSNTLYENFLKTKDNNSKFTLIDKKDVEYFFQLLNKFFN